MEALVLPASHLSSVFASSAHVTTHAVPTSRRDIPVPISRSDIPDDHASFSSVFNSAESGQVLIRVVQGGLAVELLSLSYDVSPIRFVFPASVVPEPALSSYNGQLYLIVITAVGSLYRITIPCYADGQFWHEPMPKTWCKEWHIRKMGGSEPKLVHVHDTHDIAIVLGSGGYLRLENKHVGLQDGDQWSETEWKSTNWYKALLPVIASAQDNPDEIISMGSAPAPTDLSDLFTVSRNRVLRRWTVAKGCRAEIALDSRKSDDDSPSHLLDPRPQRLLQVFTNMADEGDDVEPEEALYVLVFLPTPTSAISGGSFRLYDTSRYQWNLISTFDASRSSAHCKLQDFVLSGNMLYVLWEMQGETMLDVAHVGTDNLMRDSHGTSDTITWKRARLDQHSRMNQGTINDLLRPDSITNRYLESILRPGLFSTVTLRSALHEYREHYLSLPGPHPSPLLTTYPTLSESIAAIVGCTVTLTRDPQTGIILHNQYWNALRRDWDGFIARCTEIERSARWPLCLGVDTLGQVLVIERERISQCVEEDIPMNLVQQILTSSPINRAYQLLDICWRLKKRLPESFIGRIEMETHNILQQHDAYPLVDIIGKASTEISSQEYSEDDIRDWVSDQLSAITDFEDAVRSALQAITSLDKAVKQEEDEVELIIPPVILDWSRALATSYLTETIEARYDLCLSLSVLFFFLSDDLKGYDPTLLAEAFSIFRGIAMCRYLCRQPAGDLEGTRPSVEDAMPTDDVVSRLSSMHMSRVSKNPIPTYSLVHQLLAEYGHPILVPTAAHHFLGQLGLLDGVSPAHVTRNEVLICEKLRLMGYRGSSRYLLAWLPRTPAVCYVFGRLWIDVGRNDEAGILLQGVAGCFGPGNAILSDDMDSLDAVLPSGCCQSDCAYYLHIAELFKKAGVTTHEVRFLRLALSVWPEDGDLDEVSLYTWTSIIKGYVELGLYEDAYSCLISSPHYDQRHLYVSTLVYKMCEDNALDRLLSINFRGLVQEVEAALSFKARNADPRSRPNWSQILYTWHTYRGDYRNAALTMYIRYRRLSELHGDPAKPLLLIEQQIEALSIAMNSLVLVESKNAFIVVPSHEGGTPPRKRRKVGGYIPREQFTSSQRNVEIVKLPDIEQEYALLTATMELLRRDPALVRHGEPRLTPWLVVSKLTQAELYDLAMHTAKMLSVDMSELFQRLALQCLRVAGASDSNSMEVTSSDWLLTDKVSSWPGTPGDRAWRYLRQCLERYDSIETDYSYSKAVLETLLSNDHSLPPPWLLQIIEEYHPEHLIRSFLRYGNLETALEYTVKLVRQSTSALNDSPSKQASSTWLPYSVIDAVLKVTEENVSPPAQKLRQNLQSEVANRILSLEKQMGTATSH